MFYSQEQIDRANTVNLEEFLRSQGETLVRSGKEFRWKAHDSLTVRGNKWFRHSNTTGGYPIDFVMEFFGKSFPEAVEMLIRETGAGQKETVTAPSPEFHPPIRNVTAVNALNYLTKERGIGEDLVRIFMDAGDLYEDVKHHNVVFIGRDEHHVPRYAHCRGTAEKFRQDVSGSDKKRDDWEAKVKDLERKYNEAEKVFVYGIFQTANLTPEQLAELIRSKGTVLPQIPGGYATENDDNETYEKEDPEE